MFELMKTRNIRRDVTVYNLMVRMAKNHDDAALAFDLTAQMRAERIALDATTYDELIMIAARHNDFDTCAQLIESMYCEGADCAPHAGTYARVIVELLRAQRPDHERAQYFFDDMLAHGIAPTEEDVLQAMVKTYCACGAFAQAWDVYDRARKALKGAMNLNTHNTMMLECMWRGDTARCDALLDAAGTLDTKLSEVDFDKVFAKAGDRRGCDAVACARVFVRMRELGLEPFESTRKLVARIYAQNAEEEGREREGVEKVETITRELLEREPELNTSTTQERMKMRLDLEMDLNTNLEMDKTTSLEVDDGNLEVRSTSLIPRDEEKFNGSNTGEVNKGGT